MTTWKTIAIIFIILFTLETFSVVYLMKIGLKEINAKNDCSMKVCKLGLSDTPYESFYYDSDTNMCYCYKDNEIAKEVEIIK